MKVIDILIPLNNSKDDVNNLMWNIKRAAKKIDIDYRVILIPDGSSVKLDLTKKYFLKNNEKIKSIHSKTPLSIDESFIKNIQESNADLFAVIQPGTEYPINQLSDLITQAVEDGISIGKPSPNSIIAKYFAKLKSLLINSFILRGANFVEGVESLAIKREIAEYLYLDDTKKWGLNFWIQKLASDLGYSYSHILFSDKKKDSYKKIIPKFGIREAIKFRFSGNDSLLFKNQKLSKNKDIGEFLYKGKHFKTFSELPESESALNTFSRWQKLFFITGFIVLSASIYLNFVLTATIVLAILSTVYFLDLLFSSLLIYRSLHRSPELNIDKSDINKLENKELPFYTILCPLYKESLILPEFINSMKRIDWPKNKLEVLLLLEEDDEETLNKAKELNLDKTFKIVVVPDSEPKTKPKACNYGLNKAKGEYVVIYDAEDKPDPDQLKKAYIGFQEADEEVVCIQSKLNYYNPESNFLTRLFTAEYSLWFDLILPGLQSIDTIIPLGGTSNHFKTSVLKKLNGWDAFNVTEDCDLGVRLYVKGWKTATMNSTTYEEANSKFKNWIRQRSRWIKGYLQTYLVHMRNPIKLYKQLGKHAFLFQLIIGLRMVFILVNPLLWVLTISYFALYETVGLTIQELYPAPVLYIAVISLIMGNFIYLYNHMIALGKRDNWHLIKFVFGIPFYWLMASVSSVISFYQLVVKPHYWEKTVHGFHLGKQTTGVSIPALNIPSVRISISAPSLQMPGKDIVFTTIKVISMFSLIVIFAFYHEYIYSFRNIDIAVPLFISALILTLYQHFQKHYRGAILGYSAAIFGTVSYEYVGAVDANSEFILYYSLMFFITAVLIIKRRAIVRSLNFLSNTNGNKNFIANKYKILIFNWRDIKHESAGGAEVYIHELAERWVDGGNKVTLFCGNDGNSKRHEFIKGVEVYRRGGLFTVYFWAFIYYIFKFRSKYDVVIDSSNAIPFFTPLYSRAVKILIIHHLHEQEIKRRFIKPFSNLACYIETKLTPLIYKNNSVVTVSKSTREDLIRLGLNKENISVITPCVDTPEDLSQNKSNFPHFVYLGRLRFYKNIDVAIKAFRKISKDYPQARLTIAGEGEAMDNLKRLAKELGIKRKVRFTGYVSEKKKSEILSNAWVALQPSSYEGWGITVLEANAHSTPVISAKVKGLKDSVINDKTGILVDEIKEEEFAKAMQTLLESETLLNKLSTNARKWTEFFDWDKNAHVFMRVIENELTKDRSVAKTSPVYETIKEYKL